MFEQQNFAQFAPQTPQGGFSWAQGYGYPPRPVQRPQSGPGWIFVPMIKDAASVSVPPGQTAWIMAQNEAAFAVRTADPTGVTTTRFYRFEEFDGAAAPAPTAEYVTRAEFDAFVKKLMEGVSADE